MKKLWASGFIAVTLFLLCIGIGAAAESISGPSPSQVQQDPICIRSSFRQRLWWETTVPMILQKR